MKFNFEFIPNKGRNNVGSSIEPLVTVTAYGVSFNKAFVETYPNLLKGYAKIGIDYARNYMQIIIEDVKTDDSFKLQANKKANIRKISSTGVANTLDQTERLSLKRFRYRFKPVEVDPRFKTILVNLADPYSKTRVNKG